MFNTWNLFGIIQLCNVRIVKAYNGEVVRDSDASGGQIRDNMAGDEIIVTDKSSTIILEVKVWLDR